MNRKLIIPVIAILAITACTEQSKKIETPRKKSVLTSSVNPIQVKVNDEMLYEHWTIDPTLDLDVCPIECEGAKNKVTFEAGGESVSFNVSINDTIDFDVLHNGDTAHTRIVGVLPNATFTEEYIKENSGKVKIAIPEVSELANILVALHPEAETDWNMTDSKSNYYKRVKKHFQPHLDHPMMDTIQKYITGLRPVSETDTLFSDQSYMYYYALKMNACAYHFDGDRKIANDGYIREMAYGWNAFDPMKDIELMEDFAKKSNFKAFYEANQPYYDSLLVTYEQLNPIGQMQRWLDQKFGFTYGNYAIYFSPLVYGAHSTQNFSKGDFNQSIMFIAKAEMDEKYTPVMNELLESRVVFTEIDHNYVNPVSDKYLKEINEVFADRDFWAEGEKSDMYNNPYKVFNEYMTFGVYTLYVNDHYDQKELLAFLPKMEDMMVGRGFYRFESFNRELLKKYQENTSISMDDLYQHMFKWCSEQQNN